MTRRKFLATLGFMVVLGLAGCPQEKAEDTIKIGVAGPFSGPAAAFGDMIRMGAELKIAEINDAGGIDGKKVVAVFEDDRSDTTEAANVSRKLASDDSIKLVIGHFNSTCSIAGKQEYNRKGVVQFTPGSTNVAVCEGGDWTFRNLYRDDYQGTFLARYAKDVLGADRAAVFFENDDYGKGLMEAFKKEADAIGLELTEPVTFMREQTQDFKPLVEQIKGEDVDVIFVSGLYNEAALIAKAARQDLGLEAPILAGDGVMNDKFIELAGDSAEGCFVTAPFLFDAAKDDPKAKEFFETFQAKYERDPDTWAALTYDAVGMALEGIEKAGADRQKIRDWLAGRDTLEEAYEGVTGPTYFDPEGDCYSKGAHVAVVKDGAFVAAEQQLELE